VDAVKEGTLAYTVMQPVATFTAKAVEQADTFLKTGKTGASSEKQLFDCVLITKENAAKITSIYACRLSSQRVARARRLRRPRD
jgi:erythritol transport system substrate-binding protein